MFISCRSMVAFTLTMMHGCSMRSLHVLDCSLPEVVAGYTVRTHAILRAQRERGMVPAGLTGILQPRADEGDAAEVDGIVYHRTAGRAAYGAARTRGERERIFASAL